MSINKYFLKLFLCLVPVLARSKHVEPNGEEDGKELLAVRIDEKVVIDGAIDPLFELSTFKADQFTTLEPLPGLPSAYKTEVSVLYNDQAIFIAAKMYDDDPDNIIRDLSPRDRVVNSDFFGVTFDPYKAGLTGLTFRVTAAGVQIDAKTTESGDDTSWNDVWKSAVQIDDDGWSLEMEIPYSALRFPTGEANDWNIQFIRSVRSTREESYWNPIDPAVDGFLTQMGTLKDIREIDAPLRLSVTPYAAAQVNTMPNSSGDVEANTNFSGGLDLKYGINEAFTLDMILIPDFSQVRSDIQVLNLSPFEVRFDENRPFFTEGVELFRTANLFYSRRIGGRALLGGEIASRGDFDSWESLPNNNLVNSTKISGRTNGNIGVGFFNAVEASTYATYFDTTGQVQRTLANPLTNYNVSVVEKALPNNSKFSIVNTNVSRRGTYYDANVTGAEWNLRNKGQKFDLRGRYALSQKYQEEGTDLGYVASVNAGKIQGQWTYRGSIYIESANYNINDLGFLRSPNEMNFSGQLNFTKFKPKQEKIANYRFRNSIRHNSLYSPNVFSFLNTESSFTVRLKSFDAFGITVETNPLGYNDYFEPRTTDFSKFLRYEPSGSIGGFISSDYRKPVAIDVRFTYFKYAAAGRDISRIYVAPRFRLNSKIFIVPSFDVDVLKRDMGYVRYQGVEGLNPEVDIMIGTRDITSYTNTINAQYNMTNKMSLNWEISHYFSTVQYEKFGILQDDGSRIDNAYTGITEEGEAIQDTNYNFFTMNGVFIWRFSPGSDLIVSYKTNFTTLTESRDYFQNVAALGDFYQFSGFNVKALYFLDVNRLIKGQKS